jgi:hypothetical protein
LALKEKNGFDLRWERTQEEKERREREKRKRGIVRTKTLLRSSISGFGWDGPP